MNLLLFVKENSIILLGGNDQQPDYNYSKTVTVFLYEIMNGADITSHVTNELGEITGSET